MARCIAPLVALLVVAVIVNAEEDLAVEDLSVEADDAPPVSEPPMMSDSAVDEVESVPTLIERWEKAKLAHPDSFACPRIGGGDPRDNSQLFFDSYFVPQDPSCDPEMGKCTPDVGGCNLMSCYAKACGVVTGAKFDCGRIGGISGKVLPVKPCDPQGGCKDECDPIACYWEECGLEQPKEPEAVAAETEEEPPTHVPLNDIDFCARCRESCNDDSGCLLQCERYSCGSAECNGCHSKCIDGSCGRNCEAVSCGGEACKECHKACPADVDTHRACHQQCDANSCGGPACSRCNLECESGKTFCHDQCDTTTCAGEQKPKKVAIDAGEL